MTMEEARAEIAELLDILRWLHDLQNGCPLPSYDPKWTETMARALIILKKHDA